MGIAVISSIMGGYDSVPPVPRGFSDAVLVSDVPIISDWRNVVLQTGLPPRLAAKIPKFRPDLFTDLNVSVWMDATVKSDNGWLSQSATKYLQESNFCLFKHPERDSVSEEVSVSETMQKYSGFPLSRQLLEYKKQGFLDNVGLFACGVIARRHVPEVRAFGDAWFLENARWSIQDQLSFPFLVWSLGLSTSVFEEDLWKGPLGWKAHIGPDIPQ